MAWNPNLKFMSVTKAEQFRSCPRLYLFGSELKYERVKEEGTRRSGTMYHAGLEQWWTRAGEGATPWLDEALVAAIAAITANGTAMDTDPYEVARAEAMMIGYHAKWADLEFTRIEQGVEVWFKVPLIDERGRTVDDWMFTGRKDAQVLIDGVAKVVEHKTTSADISPGSDYWQKLSVNNQVSGYIDAARQAGLECNEVFYDVSKRPDVSPGLATPEEKRSFTKGKACKECGGSNPRGEDPIKGKGCAECANTGWKEAPKLYANQRWDDEPVIEYKERCLSAISSAPDDHYRQAHIPRTLEQLYEARADMVSVALEIDDMRARSVERYGEPFARRGWSRNTNACFNYGRRCDFYEVCSGEATLQDSRLYRIRLKKEKGK